MNAVRRTMLCAFAGGCLSNAVLFGVWRIADGARGSSAEQQHRSQGVELVAVANAAPAAAQPTELVAVTTADHAHDSATEAAPTQVSSDLDSAGPTPAGSAVSDVLTRLETAYRERVVAPAPPQAAPMQEPTTAPPPDSAVAAAEAAPSPPQPVAEVMAAPPPAAAAPPAPPAQVAAIAPAALAPQAPAMPAVAVQDIPPPPSAAYYGDINQNTYITNVREGDVYQIQMQQVAVLQYMQLLGMSGMAAPARRAGGNGRQRGALSSGIINPDNPWGFHFAPPNLVR